MNWRSRAIFMPVVAMAVLAIALSAQAGPATVVKKATEAQSKAAAAYWTRDKIANAPAMAIKVDKGPAGVDAEAVAALAEAGLESTPEFTPPGLPDPDADQVAQFAFWQDWEALSDEDRQALTADLPADELAGTRNVFTYFDVGTQAAFYNIYPHKWIGKLTFTTPTGGASCSATAISNNHIVTAAHCVYDTTNNRFYTNWVFTPAYRNGSAPYGTFAWQTARVLNLWVNLSGSYSINTWARHDVAIIQVRPNAAGRTLNSMVGWAGRTWNASYTQLNFNAGYPARIYTDASIATGPAMYLRACINESFTQTTETLGGGCYWGRGISGGPWLLNYKPFAVSGNVNSVNSGLFIGQPNLYGARFNSLNIVPLCTADGC